MLSDFWFGANQLQITDLLTEVKNRDGRDGGHLSIKVSSFEFSSVRAGLTIMTN